MLLAEPSSFHDSETAARIVEALRDANFHGLGMVEFIRAHDRDIFIEMNPRIWGPAQFCLDQAQPLLQAFIGEALHDKPLRLPHQQKRPQRKIYFWLDGLHGTITKGESPTGHSTKRSPIHIILRNPYFHTYHIANTF